MTTRKNMNTSMNMDIRTNTAMNTAGKAKTGK